MKHVLVLLSAFVALASCTSCTKTKADWKAQNERMQDVRRLLDVYLSQPDEKRTNLITIERLTTILATNGIRLYNPIRIDPSKPCYEFDTNGLQGKSSILIEEVNVNDSKMRVVGLIDGSVMMVEKNGSVFQAPD